ncbi:HNH endonuclease [Pelomonas sp. HMWF004]|nr:HNH endonuclease [Pelomonas sp. HMWF004]
MSLFKHLYNSARWKRMRARQLEAEPLCRMHEALHQLVQATVADHIKAHRGDEELFFDPENLQSLCKPCHDAHKQAQEHNANGILRGAGHDGRPLDLAHPWHQAVGQGMGAGEKSASALVEDRSLTFIRTPAKLGGGA